METLKVEHRKKSASALRDHWSDMPLGAVFVDSDGDVVLRVEDGLVNLKVAPGYEFDEFAFIHEDDIDDLYVDRRLRARIILEEI